MAGGRAVEAAPEGRIATPETAAGLWKTVARDHFLAPQRHAQRSASSGGRPDARQYRR
ncbi:hypothetical protein X907_0415 [Glycocaulis alkaliphilus]|uniref:Uncharacterized protein n=1 Tax=Glycocaulis alkaliphilus TaxID=1434191 RepID=A0A3T0E6H3_9PROT|nr:hypothetical protein X907_0415 [Glycocaulis alkaliphilus]